MSEQIGVSFILTVIFGFIFAIVYLGVRRKERMALLEKGVEPSFFISKKTSSTTLKFGMLFVGVAIGLLLGNIFARNQLLDEETAYFSMIFLFGGAGLIINYFIEKKNQEK
ncbi:MAG: hypothetical protein GY834_17350 [Bacteroidetes bacterium]|nr:hypothetical protein [Bacteroidota bacterium]